MTKIATNDATMAALRNLSTAVGLDPSDVARVSLTYERGVMTADFRVFLSAVGHQAAADVMHSAANQITNNPK